MNDRKIIYLDDAIDAIVGRTNCGTEDELRAYAARHSLENLWTGGIVDALDAIKRLPSAQPDATDINVGTTIYRQAAIDIIEDFPHGGVWNVESMEEMVYRIKQLPSAQPESCEITDEQAIEHLQSTGWMQNHDRQMYEMGLKEQLADDSGSYDSLIPNKDCISRQAAIDALHMHLMYRMGTDSNKKRLDDWINGVPSVQPERTCVNCGRTVNNGGWYADGRTRCPIEEHYALPKDGYCHLWEKRNVSDDDYPERREE